MVTLPLHFMVCNTTMCMYNECQHPSCPVINQLYKLYMLTTQVYIGFYMCFVCVVGFQYSINISVHDWRFNFLLYVSYILKFIDIIVHTRMWNCLIHTMKDNWRWFWSEWLIFPRILIVFMDISLPSYVSTQLCLLQFFIDDL